MVSFSCSQETVILLQISRAGYGGGAVTASGAFNITASAFFIENTASVGGAIYTFFGNFNVSGEIIFINNRAGTCGGAFFVNNYVNLNNVSAIANSNSALCIYQSNVTFRGRNNICSNTGTEGGGIRVIDINSHVHFTGCTVAIVW